MEYLNVNIFLRFSKFQNSISLFKFVLSNIESKFSRWCEKTANACEYSSELYKKSAVSQSRNILATIQLHEGFSKSQQDMLQKRIYKAIDLENARKSFEKSKASKKQQVILYLFI